MLIKTSELSEEALDWIVAVCESEDSAYRITSSGVVTTIIRGKTETKEWEWNFHPSTNWAQGGPIIEREGIRVSPSTHAPSVWIASTYDYDQEDWVKNRSGLTPLIAAMRSYVASKLGDTVEVPDELIIN